MSNQGSTDRHRPNNTGVFDGALDAALAGCSNCQPVLLVDRGSCTFVDKLNHSRTAMDGLVPAGAAPKVLLIDYASNGCGPYVSMSVDGLGEGALLPAFCPSDTGAALAADCAALTPFLAPSTQLPYVMNEAQRRRRALQKRNVM